MSRGAVNPVDCGQNLCQSVSQCLVSVFAIFLNKYLWNMYLFKTDDSVCSLPNLELPERAITLPESPLSMTCGESVKIQCNQGLELEGADTATCNMDGSFTWNGLTPSCN